MRRFDGKVAVVTGGGKGLGLAVVRALAAEGATVYALSASDSALREAEQIGSAVKGKQCDVTAPGQLEEVAEEIRSEHGRLDLLVNNAGRAGSGFRLHEYPIEAWDNIFATNVRGAWLTLRAFIPLMLERGGAIVNMGSIGTFRPMPKSGAYIVSKGAMLMLTRQAAVEYADDNIRVNMVAPGPILTPMVEAAGADMIRMLASRVPMRRLGEPEDVAEVTLFLLSEAARFTTGAVYTAAGGLEALSSMTTPAS